MGIFNLFFGKKKEKNIYQNDYLNEVSNINKRNTTTINRGTVTAIKVDISMANYESICKEFIAFDTETTGLSSDRDVIIEIGAVKFVDGEKTSTYGTLINEGRCVPDAASKVNHISTQMLQQNGKTPQEAYRGLVQFFDQVMNGEICICAHNASFDMGFLIT